MVKQSIALPFLRHLALAASLLLLSGCGGKMHVNTGINIPPRGRATIALNPDSANKVQLQNKGPGIVHAQTMDAENRLDSDVMLGPGSHFSDGMRGMSRITLRNLSNFQTGVSLDLKQAEGYEMRIEPNRESQ